MKKFRIVHWVLTGFFALAMSASAFMYLSANPQITGGFAHLGFPLYAVPLLGTAKALGVLALLQPRFATLREWAYAGFAINLIGAAWSHAAVGDPFVAPILFLLLLAGSYWTWKRSRQPARDNRTLQTRFA